MFNNLYDLQQKMYQEEAELAARVCNLLEDTATEWWDSNEENFLINTDLCDNVGTTLEEVTVGAVDVKIVLEYQDPYDDSMDLSNTIILPVEVALSEDDNIIKQYFYQKAKSLLKEYSRQKLIDVCRSVSYDKSLYEKALLILFHNSLEESASHNEIVSAVDKYLERKGC